MVSRTLLAFLELEWRRMEWNVLWKKETERVNRQCSFEIVEIFYPRGNARICAKYVEFMRQKSDFKVSFLHFRTDDLVTLILSQ